MESLTQAFPQRGSTTEIEREILSESGLTIKKEGLRPPFCFLSLGLFISEEVWVQGFDSIPINIYLFPMNPTLDILRSPTGSSQTSSGSSTPPRTAAQTAHLVQEIQRLKKEKQAVILAHYYQTGDIQDIADYVGDSLGLAQKGAATDAKIIVLAGVVFMAETAKILNPEKKVLSPDLAAGCSLSDNCPASAFAEFLKKYPGHTVVTYVNCSAEVKALSDILCTSSNAVKIIESIPKDQPIVFAPDQHLGNYLIKKTGRDLVLWPGSCMVHETFDAKTIVKMKARHPQALVLAHPECPAAVLNVADQIGSTAFILNYAKNSSEKEFIIVTEAGIIHQMEKACPDKIFYPVPNNESCNCAECPYMKMNSLEKIHQALLNEGPEVIIPEDIRVRAVRPLERMLELSKNG